MSLNTKMKRILIITMALLAIVGRASAQESVSVNDFLVPQGGEAYLDINYSLEGVGPYVGFMFIVDLPEGLSLVEDENTPGYPWYDEKVTAISRLSVTTTPTGFAATPKTAEATINGNSGLLMRLKVAADAELEVGSKYTATLKEVSFNVRDEEFNVTKKPVGDVTFNITIDDNRIKFDENADALPVYTAGEKGNVRMTRTINANRWSTIVLPFTLTKAKAEAAFGSDVQLAEFSGFEVDYGEDEENTIPLGIKINFTTYTMSAKKGMTGGKPFLIKTTQDVTSFEADECSLVEAVTDVEKIDEFDTPGKFTGSFVKTVVPKDGLFISGEKFYYSTGNTAIKAFRGWFELGAVLDKETEFGVKMYIDDIETGIDALRVKDATGTIYDLGGRKVAKPSQSGVYIVNGKKVMVK